MKTNDDVGPRRRGALRSLVMEPVGAFESGGVGVVDRKGLQGAGQRRRPRQAGMRVAGLHGPCPGAVVGVVVSRPPGCRYQRCGDLRDVWKTRRISMASLLTR